MGWRFVDGHLTESEFTGCPVSNTGWLSPDDPNLVVCEQTLPNWAGNLNLIHKVITNVNVLPLDRRAMYISHLSQITQVSRMATVAWTITTATARQHAEALLRTLNRWKRHEQDDR